MININSVTNPLNVPIYRSTAFAFESTAGLVAFKEAELRGESAGVFEYSRYGDPTLSHAEDALAKIEGADKALLFPSGMSAITSTLLPLAATLFPKSHFIIGGETYRQTKNFASEFLRPLLSDVTFLPPDDTGNLERYIHEDTKLIFVESPTNPYLRLTDLKRLAEFARSRGIITIVDATLASPVNLRPLKAGIDLVIHSATKYLGGHNDLLLGSVAGRSDLVDRIRSYRGMLGNLPSADSAFQLTQNLKTLELRVEAINRNGLAVARYLDSHPKISRVWYPLLKSHPDNFIASEQLTGGGGIVTFTINGSRDETSRFIDSLQIPKIAPSFGGPEALIEQPSIISYYGKSKEELAALNIPENLVRLWVGLARPELLISDLNEGLNAI